MQLPRSIQPFGGEQSFEVCFRFLRCVKEDPAGKDPRGVNAAAPVQQVEQKRPRHCCRCFITKASFRLQECDCLQKMSLQDYKIIRSQDHKIRPLRRGIKDQRWCARALACVPCAYALRGPVCLMFLQACCVSVHRAQWKHTMQRSAKHISSVVLTSRVLAFPGSGYLATMARVATRSTASKPVPPPALDIASD